MSRTATSRRRGAIHHRRHAGPRAVHAQHGHRRIDGRRGDRSWSTPARATSSRAGTLRRVAARHPPLVFASTRWTSSTGRGAVRGDRAELPCSAGSASRRRRSSRCARCTATTSSTRRRTCRGTRPTAAGHLEHLPIASGRRDLLRLPVQFVIGGRSAAARLRRTRSPPASCPRRRGRRAAVGPAHRIAAIEGSTGNIAEAFPRQCRSSSTSRTTSTCHTRRHDLPAPPQPSLNAVREFDAMPVLDDRGARCARATIKLAIKHTTRSSAGGGWTSSTLPARRQTPCTATSRRPSSALNDIGRVKLHPPRTAGRRPVHGATGRRDRSSSSTRGTNNTVAGGMILDKGQKVDRDAAGASPTAWSGNERRSTARASATSCSASAGRRSGSPACRRRASPRWPRR